MSTTGTILLTKDMKAAAASLPLTAVRVGIVSQLQGKQSKHLGVSPSSQENGVTQGSPD